MWPHTGLILLVFLLMALSSLFQLLIPLLGRIMIDEAIPAADTLLLTTLGIGMLVSSVLSGTHQNQSIHFSSYVALQVEKKLKLSFFRHLLHLPFTFFDTARIGELKQRIKDTGIIQRFLKTIFLDLSQNLLRMGFFLAGLFLLHRELGIMVSIILPIFIVNTVLFSPFYRKKYFQIWAEVAAQESQEIETIQGIRTIKMFSQEDRFLRRLTRTFLQVSRSILQSSYIHNTQETLSDLTAVAALVGVYFYGSRLILQGQFTIGGLITAIAILPNIFAPLSRAISTHPQMVESFQAIQRYEEVMQYESEPALPTESEIESKEIQGEIRLDKVSFAYIPGRDILRNINLDIQKGETLAVVGKSGAGKSTLVHLLARFYDDYRGSISLDGIDIRTHSLEYLRHNIAMVPQEPFVFRGSVRENISLGVPSYTERQLVSALRAAQCMDFVQELPQGIDSMLEEGGQNLSPGQRQRIALARVFLADPAILVLDEPASALDEENEHKIQTSLRKLRGGRTTIIIAHRLSTIMEADRIVVLEEGRIVETGRHSELITRNGVYTRLFSLMGRL